MSDAGQPTEPDVDLPEGIRAASADVRDQYRRTLASQRQMTADRQRERDREQQPGQEVKAKAMERLRAIQAGEIIFRAPPPTCAWQGCTERPYPFLWGGRYCQSDGPKAYPPLEPVRRPASAEPDEQPEVEATA